MRIQKEISRNYFDSEDTLLASGVFSTSCTISITAINSFAHVSLSDSRSERMELVDQDIVKRVGKRMRPFTFDPKQT